MRRRVIEEGNGKAPPATLTDYKLWCAKSGRRAYGNPKDPATMAEAVASWKAWKALRETWARQDGLEDELDVPSVDVDEPWDDECLGPLWDKLAEG